MRSGAAAYVPPRPLVMSAVHPPAWLEFAFYVQVVYAVIGVAIGLSVPSVGIALLALVTVGCAISMGRYSIAIVRSTAIPLLCGLSFVVIQMAIHRSDFDNSYLRDWIPWMLAVVALQHLATRRGFVHRAAIVMFLIGVATLPYIQSVGTEHRTGLATAITIANPNDLGAWFGFCCVYFATLGVEVRRPWVRGAAWSLAVVSALILAMTVSRGPLLAAGLGVAFALRGTLRKGFLPLMCLASAAWVAFALGLLDRPAELYAQRGFEETGRLQVWPLAIGRVLESPLFGAGAGHVDIYLPGAGVSITPHNAPLFIALASGVVPLLLFLAYCVHLVQSARRATARVNPDAPFHHSLLLYTLLIAMNLNVAFMLPWAMVTFASVSVGGLFAKAREYSTRADSRFVRMRPQPMTTTARGLEF